MVCRAIPKHFFAKLFVHEWIAWWTRSLQDVSISHRAFAVIQIPAQETCSFKSVHSCSRGTKPLTKCSSASASKIMLPWRCHPTAHCIVCTQPISKRAQQFSAIFCPMKCSRHSSTRVQWKTCSFQAASSHFPEIWCCTAWCSSCI